MTGHQDHREAPTAPAGMLSPYPAAPPSVPTPCPAGPPDPASRAPVQPPPPPTPASYQPDPAPPDARPTGTADRPPVPQRLWCADEEGLLALSVWTERVAGRGEDAEPFVAHHRAGLQGMLAVFDGSGGAGAAPVWQASDGASRTGAWVGARVARLATDVWFHDVTVEGEEATPKTLREYLRFFLGYAPQRRSKISGTMRRQLPTTLAGVHYRVAGNGYEPQVELQPLWAGDSRAYVLRPRTGLRVLTRDHTRESDALELLRTDPPMTNLVCADREFEIAGRRLAYPLPCVLVAATDGFFGYVHTPADFETLLLRTLRDAGTVEEWADLVRREVQGYTADDASLALVALGYHGFPDLRAQFASRHEELTVRYVRTRPRGLDRPSLAADGTGGRVTGTEDAAGLPARVRLWQDDTWRAYRAGYETDLPPAPEEHA
ncbi:serine/threonine protein phosphatase [Streptomyces sp. LP11]|uniref:Serine/threonine protein phosphatase n=1 Tax=Streptomyces pyxinicus TaxID=2970331 RepID=A0ABT2AWU2_9ACTN|nr:serine/threonine protein phosphatase [Streptomyces sp. LP11]MCS0600715.1 serine/threonine protein phosphatase [Streptomyces sp. LP11]